MNDRLQPVRGLAESKAASMIGPNGEPIQAVFVPVKAGTVKMESPDDDGGLHEVLLTKDFEIQTTEVTQRQWFLVMGRNPSHFSPFKMIGVMDQVVNSLFDLEQESINDDHCPRTAIIKESYTMCPDHPVESVSWNHVQIFIEKLNKYSQGYIYRLPTEAEWLYAARGGTSTPFNSGDNISSDRVNYDGVRLYGRSAIKGVYRKQTVAVRSLSNANALGIFDMDGNVGEWVQDWYVKDPKSGPRSVTKTPKGPPSSWSRVIRGASWAEEVRQSTDRRHRDWGWLAGGDGYAIDLGFRLVRTAK